MSLPPGVDEAVFVKVRSCIAEALGLDADEVEYSSKLIGDLGAESLDFLDIAFRLERAFDIRIPRGGIEAASKEGLAEGESYEVNGVLTPVALERLAQHMPEVPKAEFRPGLKVSEVPTLMRVGTFYNVVTNLRAAKA
ncbi:MAG: phosphopantetheine-binding protein [Myxococcota bacterium]